MDYRRVPAKLAAAQKNLEKAQEIIAAKRAELGRGLAWIHINPLKPRSEG